MTGGFNNPVIGGGGSLVYPSIHSPGFVSGLSGWTINKDGSAEFNNVIIRSGVVISGTSLQYSGLPALLGNLIGSDAGTAGTDAVGNAYLAGKTSYKLIGGFYFASSINAGVLTISMAPSAAGPYTTGVTFSLLPNGSAQIFTPASSVLIVGLAVQDIDTGINTWVPTVTTLTSDDPTTLIAATQILGQAVVTGHSYLLEAEVYFSVAVNADRLVLGFGGLTANTSFLSVAGMISGYNNNPAQVNQFTLPGSHVTGNAPNINATGYARMSCTFTMSAASTVSLSFAAGTAGQSVSVLKGTTLRLTRTS
jgi:hypothetical protein